MKLWKLNAILIILSITIFSCLENTNEASKKSKNHHNTIYDENDSYLNAIEQKSVNISWGKQEGVESFIQTDKPTSVNKTNKQKISNNNSKSKSQKRVTTKPKSTRSDSTIKLVKIANTKLKKSPINESFEKCKRKTGYLNIVKNNKNPKELHISPIFASLNLYTLNLLLSNDANTLFNSIKLDKVLRISQKDSLKQFNCFELIINQIDNQITLGKGSVTLCSDTASEMREWIEAIQAFKECQIDVKNVDHNKKVIVDFEKINELLKSGSSGVAGLNGGNSVSKVPAAQRIKSLYYENTPAINKSTIRVAEDIEIKKQVNKILGFIKKGNIVRNKIQRKMITKLKEAKKFSQQVHEKQEIIRKIVEKRAEKEKQKEESLIKIEQKSKEIELLKAVSQKIQVMKKKELKNFQKNLQKQIVTEKQHATEEANSMMRTLARDEKLTNFDDCTDAKLLNFMDKPYVNSTCMKYYGENKRDECRKEKSFCNMCCAHHVGHKFLNKLTECKSRCSDLIVGINWQLTKPEVKIETKKSSNKSNNTKKKN